MLKCSLDKIYSVFEEITKTSKLYVPAIDNDGSSVYKQWENGIATHHTTFKRLHWADNKKIIIIPMQLSVMDIRNSM